MQVHASVRYDLLGPILFGAGAVAGAWLNSQLHSKSAASTNEQPAVTQKVLPQQQPEQHDKLAALVQKQRHQIDILTKDKQRLQQDAKKQIKAQDKLQHKLNTVEQALTSLQSHYEAVSVELLQARGQLDQADKQIHLLQQRQAEVSPPIAGTQSHNNGNGIITASDAQSAASEPGKKLRIAFVGGKDLKDLQRRMLPLNAEVRHFGSSKDMGQGEMKSLEACIKNGTMDEVYMMTRWNSHGTTQWVSKLCKARGIPMHMLNSSQIVRAKAAAAS